MIIFRVFSVTVAEDLQRVERIFSGENVDAVLSIYATRVGVNDPVVTALR